MRKMLPLMCLLLAVGYVAIAQVAEAIDPAVKLQVEGVMTLALPFVVGLLKKLKVPASLVPFMPVALGALIEVGLVLAHVSDLTIGGAILVGLGVGGVASSGYDCYKKLAVEWKK